MAGGKTRGVCKDIPASAPSVSYVSPVLYERKSDSTQTSRPASRSSTSKTPAQVRDTCLRQYEHGSRRDSQISTEEEYVDVAGATSSVAEDEKEPVGSTGGNVFVCSEDDALDPSSRIPAPPSMELDDGAWGGGRVRSSSYRNSQKLDESLKQGAASSRTLLSTCPAGRSSQGSPAEKRSSQGEVQRGACRQPQRSHQQPRAQKQQNVLQLEKQPRVRERLLQRVQSGGKHSRVNHTGKSVRSRGKKCSREGVDAVSTGVCITKDKVPKVFPISPRAAASADTTVNPSAAPTEVNASRGENSIGIRGAPGSQRNEAETGRTAVKMSGRKGRVSSYALARGSDGRSASRDARVVAVAQHEPANTQTTRSAHTVDTHEDKGENQLFSTPSRETTCFSSVFSSTLSNSFLSLSSSKPHSTGRVSRLRPLQPRPTVSPPTLGAPFLLRPANGGDVCDTLPSGVRAAVCSSLVYALSDCVPRRVTALSGQSSPRMHQLLSVEHLPLFRKMVTEAEHAHWERRQQKLQSIRQQQQHHHHLRRLLEQHTWQRSRSSSSLHETNSDDEVVSGFSPLKDDRRVLRRGSKSRVESVERRRRMCAAADSTWAGRAATARVAAAARTPTFSTLRHVIRACALSRAAAAERQPKHGRASTVSSSTSRKTSSERAGYRSKSRNKPCYLWRRVKQRCTKIVCEDQSASKSATTVSCCATSSEATTECSSSRSKHRDFGRRLRRAASAAASASPTLEARGYQEHSTRPTRASHGSCVSGGRVRPEPCFHSCSPAFSGRRRPLYRAASSEVRSRFVLPSGRSASRIAWVYADGTCTSNAASASAAAPQRLADVLVGPPAAAAATGESSGFTASAESSPAALSYKTAAACSLCEPASTVSSSNAQQHQVFAARGGGAPYIPLSSNDSRSADTSWGENSTELPGSLHGAKHEKRESQHLLPVAMGSSISTGTGTVRPSCPRERYWELHNAYRRGAAGGDSLPRRLHMLQQEQQQQQVQRRQLHVEQKSQRSRSAFLKNEEPVFRLRAGERNVCREEISTSRVCVVDHSLTSSCSASAFPDQQWKSRPLDLRASAAAQRDTDGAAGGARATADYVATETDENTSPSPRVTTGAAGILRVPFRTASRSAAARPAAVSREAANRCTHGEGEPVDAFQRARRINCCPATSAGVQLPPSDTAAATGWKQKEVHWLKQRQQRGGNEHLLQYFHQQLLEHFQQQPHGWETARERDGSLLCYGFSDSSVRANLKRKDRKRLKQQQAVRHGGNAQERHKGRTAFSRDLLTPSTSGCSPHSDNAPSPFMRLQLQGRRNDVAGGGTGIDGAAGATGSSGGAAVEGACPERVFFERPATLQLAAGAAVATLTAAAAPNGEGGGQQKAVPLSASCEDPVAPLTSKAATATPLQHPLLGSPSPFSMTAMPADARTTGAPARAGDGLGGATGGCASGVTLSAPSAAAASLVHPTAAAVAVGATWPAAGFAWPAGGPTVAALSYSPMRPTNELTHKGIGVDALQQAVVRQQLGLHANGDINASSISVVSSQDCDGAGSSSRSKKAAEGDSDSIKALASRRRCMSRFPFATSRAAVAIDNDAHVARDDRKHPLLPADNKESGNYKGINGKPDKGTCTGSRSNSGSRDTANRNSGSKDGGSRSSKSDGGSGEHSNIERSSDRSTKGHSSSDNSYVLLLSQDDGGQGKSSVSIIDSSKPFCGASPHLGSEEESEQRRRGVLFPRRMPTTEAGSGADGTEVAGNFVTSTAGRPYYNQVSSKQHAAASGTVDSRCELFQGGRDTVVDKSSVFTYQKEKKPCAEIERRTCCSSDFSHTAKGATETGTERGGLVAERGPTALQLQGDSEASCPVAACRVARAESGAYELQGKHCNTGAFHAADAHPVQPGASTAASKTDSPAGAASPAAAIVEEDVAPCAAVLEPRTPTVFLAAAPGARPPTPAALPAQSANVTRAAVLAATPPSLAAAAAEAALLEAAGGIWARMTPTSVGLETATAGRSAAGPKATSSASVEEHSTADQQEASSLGTTRHASSGVGWNPEVTSGSCQEVSAERSKSEVFFESGSCHSGPHGGIPEYVHEKESNKYEMHDNKRNREDGPHEYTEAVYNGADTHSDSLRPASAADGMTASSANAAATFSNSCVCTSSFRGDCTHVAYTGIREGPAHADGASASSVPAPGGGSAAAAKAVIAVGADLPGEDRHSADIVERPHRGCPLTREVHHAFDVATVSGCSLTYSKSVTHGENRSLLASEAGVAKPPSERGSAASAVRLCNGVEHGLSATVAPCPVTAITATPAGCGSPESSAPSFYSISSANQHLQKRQKQPTQQQCLVQRPAGHQHPEQQTQQQYQLPQQSRLEQQQDLEHHPQPSQHHQQQKQWQQEQSLQRPVQQQQLQQQLQTLQQPSQVQYLGVQRSLSQEPQQRGSHASEQPDHEPIQLRQTQQEHHGHHKDAQVGDEVYRPVVMRAALPDSLTATQMSTSFFVCSNCSSRSDRSRDSITTATATPSTESLLPDNPSVAAPSYFKEKAGAAAAGRTVVADGGGDVPACAAGATGAGGLRAKDGSVAPGCAGVTTPIDKEGRAELSLMHFCAPGCGRSCHSPEEQQRQTAGGTAQDLRDDARVSSVSSVRAVTAARKTEASSPAKAVVVPVVVPRRSAAFGTKRVAQTLLHCGHRRCFPSTCRSDAESSSADNDNTSRTSVSGSLASLPSLGGSCSTEEACLAQLLTQLLLVLQDQPHGSVDAPLLRPGDVAQDQHPAEKGVAAATAGASLTGDDVVGAARTSAHGADVQLHCKKRSAHCKTTSYDCQQAASTSAPDGASLPNSSGMLAGTVPRNSKSGRYTVCVDDSNSDSSNTGHRSTYGGNALPTTVSNTEIDSCNSAVAGNGNSRVNANFALGSCSTGLTAVHMRPSSPPPRPGGAVLPEVTAAVAESSLQAAAATRPTTETAPPSTAGAPVFTAVAAAPSSAGTVASNITAAAAPTAVVCTLELKNEVTGPTSAALAAVPALWRGATGSADVRAGSAGSAQASSAPSLEEAGVQFIASRVQTPTAETEASTQPPKAPSARSSSVTQAVALQQPPPSPPAVGEYGRLPILVEGGGLLKTEAFSECGGTRGAATAAAAGLEAPSSARAAAATVGIADRSGSLGHASRCATGPTISKALPLSRTLGASADAFAGVIAGARRNEGIFMGPVSAAKTCAAPAVVKADAVDGHKAVNNVEGVIPQELAVSRMVSTAEKCLVRGVTAACLDSSKQTQPLQPLLLTSLLGMLSLDTSMLRPLLSVSPWNGRCLNCTTVSEDGVKSGNGTVVVASSQNKDRSRSSCSSCTGSCSHASQSGGFVNGSAPLSLFLSNTASAGVVPTAADDWVMTLPPQLQQAAGLSLSVLRQLSTSTQLPYSASRYGPVHVYRQQQLQQRHQRESVSMPQQLSPLQSPDEMPMMAEDSQWETEEQQTRHQLQPSQDVGRCDPHGLTEPAHQQQTTTGEVRGGTSGQNLKSATPYIVAGETPRRATAIPSGAAVYDGGLGASTVAPGVPAATAAPDVSNAGAFPAVTYSPRYCSAGEGRSLSLSQLQQTTAGSASPQQWEEQRLQLQQQLRQQKLQLEQHQLVLEQEAPAPQPDTQQFLRDVGSSSDCAAKSQRCSSLGAGAMQLSEEECRAVARAIVMLHAQHLQKATQGQRLVQPEGGKQQVEQMQTGASTQVLQVGGSEQGKKHLQAPQQSVKRRDEASTPEQLQSDQQRVQQPWDRQQDRNTQPDSSQHHRLLQQELQLHHHPNERLSLLNKTETTNAEKQQRDDWNSDGSSSDANVARKEAKRITAGRQKNRGGKKTRCARTSNSVVRSSHRRHHSGKGATRTSTREYSSSSSGRRRGGSNGETSSRSTTRGSGSTVRQKSRTSTFTTTNPGKRCDTNAAPSENRKDRAGRLDGEKSPRRKSTAFLASTHSPDDTVGTSAAAARNAPLPEAESARQKTDMAGSYPLSGRISSAHNTDVRLDTGALEKKEERKLKTSRLRKKCEDADGGKIDALCAPGVPAAATTFLVESSVTTDVTTTDAAAAMAHRELPEVSRLHFKEIEVHSRQQQPPRSERQRRQRRPQSQTRARTRYSLSPHHHHVDDQEGKPTQKRVSNVMSCSGRSKLRGMSCENMGTRGAERDSAMHMWSEEPQSHTIDSGPMKCDSKTRCKLRSSRRQDSSIQTARCGTPVPRNHRRKNRSTNGNNHGHTKRSSIYEPRSSSRRQVHGSRRHTSSSSSGVECSSRRHASFTRTGRTRWKERVAPTSTSPWEVEDGEEQVLPMLRKHLQQQRELQEELQQVEQQLAGLHLLNSLTVFSSGVSCSTGRRALAETEAQMNAALENRSTYSHKHCNEVRGRRDCNASTTCGSDKPIWDCSTCKENSRWSSSSSGSTSYYTPVSVSTASAAVVERGKGGGAHRATQTRSLNSSHLVTTEQAAADAYTFPRCLDGCSTAEASHVTIHSSRKSSTRSPRSSRSGSCERIMGREWLGLSGGKVGLAAVKQQLYGTSVSSKRTFSREKITVSKEGLRERASCFFSGSAFYCAADADCTFPRKLVPTEPLSPAQTPVGNTACVNMATQEAVRCRSHPGMPDGHSAVAAAENQREKTGFLQGLPSVQQRQQRLRSHDASQRRSVASLSSRPGKDVLLFSAAESSVDEATDHLGYKLTRRSAHRVHTSRQRTGRTVHVWPHYGDAGNAAGALASEAANQHREQRRYQQQPLQQLKRSGRYLQTSMLLDSETDGATEKSVSEQKSAHRML